MAITVAGVVSATGQNQTALTTPSRTTTAGCVLVAFVEWYTSGGAANCTLTDSKGNTWTQVAAQTNYQGTTRRIKAWVCVPSNVGTSHTFTATRGAAEYTDINICVIEWAGIDTASPIDTAALQAAATGNSAAPSGSTGTLSQADTGIAAMVGWWNTPTFTEASGFTNRCNLDSGGDDEKMAVATQIVAATTAVTYAPTLSGSTNWGVLVVPLKGASTPTAGLASEADAAYALVGRQERPAGLASEVDRAYVASNAAPTFVGYNILDQLLVVGTAALSYDVSAKFTDISDTLTYSAVGSWPSGITVSSAGVISGTPGGGSSGTYANLKVRATDTAAQTVDSNAFTIVVAASGVAIARRSVGTAGDYANPHDWAAITTNLVTANTIWQGQCLNQEFVVADSTYSPNYAVRVAGSTTDATRYKHLTTAAGCSFRDHANKRTNALRYDATKGAGIRFAGLASACFTVEEIGFRMSNMQVKTGDSTAGGYALFTSQLSKTIYENCIFESAAYGFHNFTVAASGVHDFINCLIVNIAPTGADHIVEGSAGVSWYSCTIAAINAAATYGLSGGNNAGTADGGVNCNFTNTVIVGCGQLRQWNSPGTITNCYTDGSSRPTGFSAIVLNTTTGTGFENITVGTHDLRIKSTSALRDAGTTDSQANGVDIVGYARPQGSAYDVGAWEADNSAGLASETEAAYALAGYQQRAAGLSSEADQAFALAGVQYRAAGLASEVDAAYALGAPNQVGLASEVDRAFSLLAVQQMSAGLAHEIDAAYALNGGAAPTLGDSLPRYTLTARRRKLTLTGSAQ